MFHHSVSLWARSLSPHHLLAGSSMSSSYSPVSTGQTSSSDRRPSHLSKSSLPPYRSPSNEKRSFLRTILPDPSHPRATFRTLSTGILFLFAMTVLWLAVVEPGVGQEMEQGIERGTGWMRFKNVGWGDGEASSEVGSSQFDGMLPPAGEDEYKEYTEEEVTPILDDELAEEQPSEPTQESKPAWKMPISLEEDEKLSHSGITTSENEFSPEKADEVRASVASGRISGYKWHTKLGSDVWNPDKTTAGRLIVTGTVFLDFLHPRLANPFQIIGDIHGQFESLKFVLLVTKICGPMSNMYFKFTTHRLVLYSSRRHPFTSGRCCLQIATERIT